MYNFTNDWFNNTKPIWDSLIPQINPSKLLEIGSYEGNSACYLVDNLANKQDIELTCIDLWPIQEIEERFDQNIQISTKKAAFNVSFQKKKDYSYRILSELIKEGKENYFDLVYVDGSHLANDVIFDACFAFKLCRPGGVIIFDDYLWPLDKSLEMKPKIAIDAFTNIFHDKISILRAPLYQLYVIKNEESV